MSTFKDRTQNRWRSILEHFGVERQLLNGKHQSCPFCGGKDRFRFDDKRGNGSWICSQCGAGGGADLLMGIKQWDFKTMADKVEEIVGRTTVSQPKGQASERHKRQLMQRTWEGSRAITRDDPVARWLQNRVGNILFPSCLRYHPELFYNADPPTYHPAMIARVDGPDGRPTTIHRTYLTPEGTKARLESQRSLMPGTLIPGSAVRLFEPKSGRLAVAEGIETALAVVKSFALPAWALVNAVNMERFVVPDAIEELFIFADHDPGFAGQAAAYTLARRVASKIKVHVILPENEGQDWNDVLESRRSTWSVMKNGANSPSPSPSSDTPTSSSLTAMPTTDLLLPGG